MGKEGNRLKTRNMLKWTINKNEYVKNQLKNSLLEL